MLLDAALVFLLDADLKKRHLLRAPLPDKFTTNAKLAAAKGQLLLAFSSCFTTPSFQRFITLMTGWMLCTGKRTVTGVMRAAAVVGEHEHSGYHRFFSRGAWDPDAVGYA